MSQDNSGVNHPCMYKTVLCHQYCLDLYIFAGFQYQTCLENRQIEQFLTVFNYCIDGMKPYHTVCLNKKEF